MLIVTGVLLALLVPGATAAAWCLSSKSLRRRAIQLQRSSIDQVMAGYLLTSARTGGWRSRVAFRLWRQARDRRILQLVLIALVLILSGPRAFARVRSLRRSSAEIRFE
ncbi:MAG: hypothetical protein Q8R35_02485 [bacterium]|nr:hypothetical protein [bacterium]